MKLLSDFDGVLTNQTEEAERVLSLFKERLFELSGGNSGLVESLFKLGFEEMEKKPSSHGWRSQGRVTAYANEDLFIRNNGLAACLDDFCVSNSEVAELQKKIVVDTEYSDFSTLANWAFGVMAGETKAGERKPLDPEAVQVIREFLSEGIKIVVVSNSGTERIVAMFEDAGLKVKGHDADPDAQLRIRGGAKKYELGAERSGFNVGDYWIDTTRPFYQKILDEERPQAVIGDVFSLDIALPLHMAKTSLHGLQAFLRKQAYTPDWTKTFFSNFSEGFASLDTLTDFKQIKDKLVRS
jgi:FMN phosphatase YigB (HAD superfamily)